MKQFFSYSVLLLILLFGLIGTLVFRYHPLKLPVIFLASAAYFIWGVVHHALLGTLHRQVVLEYLAVACLGAIIIATLL